MAEIIHVGGARGVGKSRILTSYASEHPDVGVFEYGQEMRNIALEYGLIQDESEFSGLDEHLVAYLRREAAERLGNLSQSCRQVMVSSHYAIPNKGRFISTFKEGKNNDYDAYVLIEADPEMVQKWVNSDSKYRESSELQWLEDYIAFERHIAEKVSDRNDRKLVIIPSDDLEAAVEEVRNNFRI